MKTEQAPAGWEPTTHCGYEAYYRGNFTIYRSPNGRGWVRVLIFAGGSTPTSSAHFRTLTDAAKGI